VSRIAQHLRARRSPVAPDTAELHAAAWSRRVGAVREALGGAPATATVAAAADLGGVLNDVVDHRDRSHVWLVLAVLTGRLPDRVTVVEVARASEFDHGASLWSAVAEHTTDESAGWDVRLASDEVLVDVAHTASTDLTTGIQRVARETTRRWLAGHQCTPVSWSAGFDAIRELTPTELRRIQRGAVERRRVPRGPVVPRPPGEPEPIVVVPWRATYIVPELAAEPARSIRLLALAELTPTRTGVIGFDCVPITSAETTQLGFAGVFAGNLAAVRHFDRVAAISQAAATEYSGWRSALSATGLTGPTVTSVPLPVEGADPTTDDTVSARERFVVGHLPLVLAIGSHEPRKNHLAVLHAAELLWREGVRFSLSFIGGNSWGSDEFMRRLAELQRAGRPVDTESRLSDGQLWAAYRLARCTVFPSLNEGFGLPVAESLAAGTPAVTSDFGSMRELAEEGGALMVDPHDDHDIADALRRLLVDDQLHAELRRAALSRRPRPWDAYAEELWSFLVAW
jgi:glycosyltransferase involved in cell wall biosynthesis